MHFGLHNGRIGEMMTRQQLNFDVRIRSTGRIHRFQIPAIENVDGELIGVERGADSDATKCCHRIRRLHGHSFKTVKTNQFGALRSVQFQQSTDPVKKLIVRFSRVRPINGIGGTVETAVDDVQSCCHWRKVAGWRFLSTSTRTMS